MQNNFEKDVQQKMDGLKLTPSDAVWERVEVEIAVAKKKRRGLIWFLLAGTLLLGGGWWAMTLFRHSPETVSQTALRPHDGVKNRQTKNPPAGKQINTATGQTEYTAAEPAEPLGSSPTKPPEQSGIATGNVDRIHKKAFTAGKQAEKTALVSIPASTGKPESSGNVAPGRKRTQKNVQQPVLIGSPDLKTPVGPNNTHTPKTDSATKQTDANEPPLPDKVDSAAGKNEAKENDLPKADSSLKKKVASAKKWRPQVTIGAGISRYAAGPLFTPFNTVVRDALYASPNAVTGGQSSAPAQPSLTSAGPAFSLGFSLGKSLGQRWEISLGLQYAYASARQKVGDKKNTDTTIQFSMDKVDANGFYTNTGKNGYTNRFHFVELPVTVSYRPSLRWPLHISLGAAYGRLLSTNALTFSSASNLYYQNNQNYVRSALSLSSSVGIDLLKKKKTSLRAGPYVQYGLLKLQKENPDGTPHLLLAGLRTTLRF